MRIRRLRWGNPVRRVRSDSAPLIARRKTSRVWEGGEKPVEPPTADSLLHPAVDNIEHGLHKYATGLFYPERNVSNLFKAHQIAWKLYTDEALTLDSFPPLLAALDYTSTDVENIAAAPSNVHLVFRSALRTFGSFPSARDVFIQLIGGHHGRLPAVAQCGPSFSAMDTYWNVYMRMHRFRIGGGLSRPWFTLTVPTIRLSNLCNLTFASTPVADGTRTNLSKRKGDTRVPMSLLLRFGSHLKPSVCSGLPNARQAVSSTVEVHAAAADPSKTDDTKPRIQDVIQPTVDAVLTSLGAALHGKTFRSANETLQSVETCVLQLLRSLPLASIVDFHHVQAELCDWRKMRVLRSRLLETDGRPRERLEDEKDGPINDSETVILRPEERSATHVGKQHEFHGSTNLDNKQSKLTRASEIKLGTLAAVPLSVTEKLGISSLHPKVRYLNAQGPLSLLVRPDAVLADLGAICAKLPETESALAACLSAASYLRSRFSDTSLIQLTSSTMPYTPPWSSTHVANEHFVVRISTAHRYDGDESSYPTVNLRAIQLPEMTARINRASRTDSIRARSKIAVGLRARNPAVSRNVGVKLPASKLSATSLADDVAAIAETAYSLEQRLFSGMIFYRWESVPNLLSEALIRTLRAEPGRLEGEVVWVSVECIPVASELPVARADTLWRDDVASTNRIRVDADLAPVTPLSTVDRIDDPVRSAEYGSVATLNDGAAGDTTAPTLETSISSRDENNVASMVDRDGSGIAQAPRSTPRLVSGIMSRGVFKTSLHRVILCAAARISSQALFEKTAVHRYGYTAQWPPHDAPSVLSVLPDLAESIIENHLSTASEVGFDCLRSAVVQLSNTLPNNPTIKLQMQLSHAEVKRSAATKVRLSDNLEITACCQPAKGLSSNSLPNVQLTITMPEILGVFPMTSPGHDNRQTFVRLHLQAEIPTSGRQGRESGADSESNVPRAVTRTLEVALATLKPVFAGVKTLDAINDDLAQRAGDVLAAKAEDVFFSGALLLRRIVISVGTSNSRPPSGTATVYMAGKEPTDENVTKGEETAATADDDGRAGAHATSDIEDQPGAIPTSPCSPYATLPHEDGERAEVQDQGEDAKAAQTGSSPKLHPFGLRTGVPPKIRSQHLLERAGLNKFGLTATWRPAELSAILAPSQEDITQVMRHQLEDVSAMGLRYLHLVADSTRQNLPGHPVLEVTYSRQSDEQSAGGRLSDGLDIRLFSTSNTRQDKQYVPMSIRLPELGDIRWGRGSSGTSCLVGLIVFGSLKRSETDEGRTNLYDLAVCIINSVADLLRPIFADYDTSAEASALAQDAVEALIKAQGVFPVEWNTKRLHLIVGRSISNKVTILGKAKAKLIDRPQAVAQDAVLVALGSNVGDRLEAIETACRAIDEDSDMRIKRTSCLYETEPMYVRDQERFLNGACEIETSLEPIELLDRLQAIENQLGRVKMIDKGPRNIDLDILLYKGRQVKTERLIVPHALMKEREFVLRPLADIYAGRIPPSGQTVASSLRQVKSSPPVMFTQTPLGSASAFIRATDSKRKTQVMSILNVTPDSFSDGGANQPADPEALKATVSAHIAAGATIIDIGGQSSRPNAPDVTAEEEIARILPAIEAIRSLPEAEKVAISIDTYRAAVAEAAISAGAHIINDISAGLLDPEMLSKVAQLSCTFVMMHMRGTPATMQDSENLQYPDGLIPTVAKELRERVDAAEAAGIRRWRMVLDPGVGFAKTQEQNLELLRELPRLINAPGLQRLPWLVGTSRKGFVGKVTGVTEAKERTWGTAATITAAVQGGADIVRVHDVSEMAQVVKMSDAMYRV